MNGWIEGLSWIGRFWVFFGFIVLINFCLMGLLKILKKAKKLNRRKIRELEEKEEKKKGENRFALLAREAVLNFLPIEGLKAGDQVIYKGGAFYELKKGDVATVCRVLKRTDDSTDDFTLLFTDGDGNISEFYLDSRFFERKENA